MYTLPRRSSRTRSASRGTDLEVSQVPLAPSSQPLPQPIPPLAKRQVTSHTQPNPEVTQGNSNATSAEIPPAPNIQGGFVPCGICQQDCEGQNDVGEQVIGCEGQCAMWFHIQCVNVSISTFTQLSNGTGETNSWICYSCREIPANIPPPAIFDIPQTEGLMWGKHTLGIFEEQLNLCYKEIVTWKKNLFFLPSGRIGKEFIC